MKTIGTKLELLIREYNLNDIFNQREHPYLEMVAEYLRIHFKIYITIQVLFNDKSEKFLVSVIHRKINNGLVEINEKVITKINGTHRIFYSYDEALESGLEYAITLTNTINKSNCIAVD